MPTPFTHLAAAARWLTDERLPVPMRQSLDAERPAFLLGNIAADARVSSGILRENTHFYSFSEPITESPWRVMLREYPALARPQSVAQRAFIAGYVAHLVLDEIWLIDIVRPYFVERLWETPRHRLLMLNILLILMDERDYGLLPAWERDALLSAQPSAWLPFMSDEVLCGWRDYVGKQLPPGGIPETLSIIGERLQHPPDALRAILDRPATLDRDLWAHVPHDAVAAAEARMYTRARDQMLEYWLQCDER